MRRAWVPILLISSLLACGGSYRPAAAPIEARSYSYGATTASVESQDAPSRMDSLEEEVSGGEMDSAPPSPPPAMEPAPVMAPGDAGGGASGIIAQADVRRREAPRPQVPQQASPTQAPDETRTATDATSGPLLIYLAVLNLAVYQVQDNQRSVIAIAREVDGYLQQQNDTVVVIRVPARRFQEALGRIEALGDVLSRNIQATDVSEEFRDTQIRLRNLEQVRDRLAALLAQARTVEESLQIERELERLTTEIESMKGRIRFLEDRLAYSTITVNFSPREQETLQGELFNLPFDFLYNLGLRTLLNLR